MMGEIGMWRRGTWPGLAWPKELRWLESGIDMVGFFLYCCCTSKRLLVAQRSAPIMNPLPITSNIGENKRSPFLFFLCLCLGIAGYLPPLAMLLGKWNEKG